jgi:hypothetical protein
VLRLAVVVLAAFAVALPAGAATVDPKGLVIGPAQVPAGFRVDPDETGLRTNEREATDHPETRPLFRRWGRLTGYQVRYEKSDDASIEARADLFENASGAQALHRWVDRETQKSGIKGLVRARARIGSEGAVYSFGRFTLVYWRYGRAWSGIAAYRLTPARTMALARAQQRRIAAAIRP